MMRLRFDCLLYVTSSSNTRTRDELDFLPKAPASLHLVKKCVLYGELRVGVSDIWCADKVCSLARQNKNVKALNYYSL